MPIRTPYVMSTSRKRLKTIPTPRICPATYVNDTKIAHTTATIRASRE